MPAYDLEGLSHLPGLERVGSRNDGYPGAAAGLALLVLAVGGLTVYGLVALGEYLPLAGIAACWVMLATLAFVLARVLVEWTGCETGREGITLTGLFKKRRIPWAEVSEARFHASGTVTLLGSGLRTKLPPYCTGLAVAASILQHAKHAGLDVTGAVSEDVLRVWSPVPEPVPESAVWKPGKGSAWSLGPGRVQRAEAGPKGLLIVTRRGSHSLAWDDIVQVKQRAESIFCRTGAGRSSGMRIPLLTGDRESELFVLCAVRHLRQSENALAVSLPVTSVEDAEFWKRPGFANRSAAALAVLRTMSPEARRRVGRYRLLASLAPMLGLIVGGALGFLNVPGYVARAMHSVPPGGYLLVLHGLVVALPLMMLGIAAFGVAAEALGARVARDHRADLEKLQSVQRTGQKMNAALLALLGVMVLAVVVHPFCYTQIGPEGLQTRGLTAPLGRRAAWREVTCIRKTERWIDNSSGQSCPRMIYEIHFAHEKQPWRVTDDSVISVFPRGDLDDLLAYASRHSGKPVRKVRAEE